MMRLHSFNPLKAIMETEGSFQLTTHEVFEMHLFDEGAAMEQSLCLRDTAYLERRGIRGYLEDRLRGSEVGAVCQECKVLSIPLAEDILEVMVQNFEDEGQLGDAEDCRQLAVRLAQEVGRDRKRD